ncbi:MAG: sulfurtransferase, partial [Solirubrobacterales bacterium]|nr:sulfurtransferase [Solirubrobacterales bacterium]
MLPPFSKLEEVLALSDARLLDCRWYLDGRRGKDAYLQLHIPGAVFIDLDRVLADPPGEHGRHPLPSPERFAAGMSAAGVSDSDTVVAYDDAGGTIAARLVWMLRVTGHDATVLDGGIDAWPARDLVHGPEPEPAPGSFTARPWPAEHLADIDTVARGDAVLID